ncbi:riboflavin transporter FmnP [Bacillus safensis]|nr:ECF transporter S component [Bacillus safensis]KML13655.1 riboflavin transporter FmnP [Bacillus safensis]KML50429.1 riboflavin transporter FmnP [Bacillus safensis]KMN78931.1 riboflavin transporter FmnP [Bacillus safensis]MBG9818749.1 riboflavin transporter FmnP [Bacillus safensis]MCK8451811.1 ECF transporter S component [Bacillus safensis]
MLSSISFVLILLDFPFPGLPAYLKIDFSDIPAIIAILIYGPGAGIAVEALKNVLHYLIQGSMSGVPVGQVANFIAGTLFILPVAFMFKKIKSAKGMAWSMIVGTLLMTVMMSILNYFLFLPAYTWFLNAPELSDHALKTTITAGILPFNFIKGIIITIVFSLIFVKMRPWFENKRRLQNS